MTNIDPARLARFDAATLEEGSHSSLEEGGCFMEWVSYLAGERHSDRALCVSPVLRRFAVGVNDRWDTPTRQRLKPFGPRMVGTAGDGQDDARAYLALDWLARTYTPAWLDLAGLGVGAATLRGLPPIVDREAAVHAVLALDDARGEATAAWAAARAAAGTAAWAAARTAAWGAAGTAAGDAARTAAGGAARAAAGDATGTAARTAAWGAAGTAAGDAARTAAGDATGDAARTAAWAALKPTVEMLQTSALDLLDRMISPKGRTS